MTLRGISIPFVGAFAACLLAARPLCAADSAGTTATLAKGGFLDPVKLVALTIWLLAWTWVVGALGRDANRHRTPPSPWMGALAAAGMLSMLPFLAVQFLPLTLFFSFVFFAPIVLGYIWVERNPRLRPSEQLLTDEHVARIARRFLDGLGVAPAVGEDGARRVGLMPGMMRRRSLERSPHLADLTDVLESAVQLHAAEVLLELLREKLVVRFRVDGIWCADMTFERAAGDGVLNLLKCVAGLDPTDRRLQNGSLELRVGRKPVAVRVAASGSSARERVSLRLAEFGPQRRIADLGVLERDQPTLRLAANQSTGLMLVAGPVWSGRRTTLYACVEEVDSTHARSLVVDDPSRPGRDPDDPTRVPFDLGKSANPYADGLRAAVGLEPAIILLGRLQDSETVQLALEASKRCLVMASIEADNAVGGVFRLLDLGASRERLAESLVLAASQRLPRKLCEACREAYRPPLEAFRRANLRQAGVDTLYRAPQRALSSCSDCRGLGFRGCTGIFEFLPLTTRVRQLIRAGGNEREVGVEARKEGMDSLSEAGMKLVLAGATSAEELRRVLTGAGRTAVEA